MKPGDLVRLKSRNKHTPYSHGVIIEIVDATVRGNAHVMARVHWQHGVQTDEIMQDFLHYYEVVSGE